MREFLIIIAVSDSPTEVTKHEISSCFASNPVLEDLTATSYHACFVPLAVEAKSIEGGMFKTHVTVI